MSRLKSKGMLSMAMALVASGLANAGNAMPIIAERPRIARVQGNLNDRSKYIPAGPRRNVPLGNR